MSTFGAESVLKSSFLLLYVTVAGTDFICYAQPGRYYFIGIDRYGTYLTANSQGQAEQQCKKGGGEAVPDTDKMPLVCQKGLEDYLDDYGISKNEISQMIHNYVSPKVVTSGGKILCRRELIFKMYRLLLCLVCRNICSPCHALQFNVSCAGCCAGCCAGGDGGRLAWLCWCWCFYFILFFY